MNKVIEVLDKNGIDYMISGSIASSILGEPRATHDIDIVIEMKSEKAKALCDQFPPPDYYLDEESIKEAIKVKGHFNLIYTPEGDKVDFWLTKDESFDRSRFGRKKEMKFEGLKLKVSTPEDIILMKLYWAKISGGSERQFTDALRVYEVQFNKLDLGYLDTWAKRLDVENLLENIKKEAEKP